MENSSQNINVGNDALKKIETDKMSQDVKKDERAHEDESLEVIVDKRIIFLNAAKLKGGEVYACYLDKKQEVALKKIDLNQISEFKGVISGLEKFKEKSHDNIVKYLHYAEKNNFFYIAMEMGTQENLMDHDCKATDIKRFFQSITNGLDYLHDNEIGECFIKI